MANTGDLTAMETLRDLVSTLNDEVEAVLDDLPTIGALIAYRELWDRYDTEYLEGIIECIEQGADPAPYNAFVRKYKLTWGRMPQRGRAA